MNKLIFNPFSPIPKSQKSHVRGWSMIWAELLGAKIADKDTDLTKADVLYLDHGVNFGGSLNLFGGVTGEVIDQLIHVLASDTPLVSLDIPMPKYADELEKRLGQSTCNPALKYLLKPLRDREVCKTKTMAGLHKDHVTIGDSHASAFSPAGSSVIRMNGQTLHGALRDDVVIKQLDALGYTPKRVTLVFGSIDIRHHIGRQDDPGLTMQELCKRYAELVVQIKSDYLCEVEVAAPVPVEHEWRKIPKTGYYKGQPFYGSQMSRRRWTADFIAHMQDAGVSVVTPPPHWYTCDGEQYAKDVMEMGGSVHIAPTFYRRYSLHFVTI